MTLVRKVLDFARERLLVPVAVIGGIAVLLGFPLLVARGYGARTGLAVLVAYVGLWLIGRRQRLKSRRP